MQNTDVFREPIRENLNQKTSILHSCHFQSTMLPFRRAENHERGCGSSTDLEVKASFGHPAVTCRLLKSRSVSLVVYADVGDKNKPTFCLVQFAHNFLHNFYHPVRYSVGLLPLVVIKKHTQSTRDINCRFVPVGI